MLLYSVYNYDLDIPRRVKTIGKWSEIDVCSAAKDAGKHLPACILNHQRNN